MAESCTVADALEVLERMDANDPEIEDAVVAFVMMAREARWPLSWINLTFDVLGLGYVAEPDHSTPAVA